MKMVFFHNSQIFTGLLLGLVINRIDAKAIDDIKSNALTVAVIGAGPSGLCSAKHSLDQGYNVTVYEQAEEIGGAWYYTDEIGYDKYGVKIQTAMYQGLKYT